MTTTATTQRHAAPLRARRAAAARALQDHPRRAQLTWDDLAAWPDWAALDDEARAALALRTGAWWHAGTWQHCINGTLLRALQAALGPEGFARLLAAPGDAVQVPAPGNTATANAAAAAASPREATAPPEETAALAHTGLEALLASVASPLLRMVLRERFAPGTLPPLPALDAARARRAVQAAQVASNASNAPGAQAAQSAQSAQLLQVAQLVEPAQPSSAAGTPAPAHGATGPAVAERSTAA
jgi:hypothetical protein